MFAKKKIAAGEEVMRVNKPDFYVASQGVCDNCLQAEYSGVNKSGRFNRYGDAGVKNKLCEGCKKVGYCSKVSLLFQFIVS